MPEGSQPAYEIALAHFIVSEDVERSRRFYTEVLGGETIHSGSRRTWRSPTAAPCRLGIRGYERQSPDAS